MNTDLAQCLRSICRSSNTATVVVKRLYTIIDAPAKAACCKVELSNGSVLYFHSVMAAREYLEYCGATTKGCGIFNKAGKFFAKLTDNVYSPQDRLQCVIDVGRYCGWSFSQGSKADEIEIHDGHAYTGTIWRNARAQPVVYAENAMLKILATACEVATPGCSL